jgi:phage baseplate assembly protein W
MRTTSIPTKFSDFNLSFVAHPNTGDITLLKNEDAVKNAVKNLVMTGFYERPFYPDKGCGIYQSLFELISPATAISIQNHIETTLYNWEPRVAVTEIDVTPDYDNNGYAVTIRYEILNEVDIKEIGFFLERIK